ncbi:MAG: chorismate-binding protein [Phycisphaerales bacterium]|nr:MAG: chorismate-binding protein [Phycisphaerales bacterium]
MLVDLGRNEVGKVAGVGSVVLSNVMSVECCSHMMCICTNVAGLSAERMTTFDALCGPRYPWAPRGRSPQGAGHADHGRARTTPPVPADNTEHRLPARHGQEAFAAR